MFLILTLKKEKTHGITSFDGKLGVDIMGPAREESCENGSKPHYFLGPNIGFQW
jgi:hypothetical protein